jgi:hypothetical protein
MSEFMFVDAVLTALRNGTGRSRLKRRDGYKVYVRAAPEIGVSVKPGDGYGQKAVCRMNRPK